MNYITILSFAMHLLSIGAVRENDESVFRVLRGHGGGGRGGMMSGQGMGPGGRGDNMMGVFGMNGGGRNHTMGNRTEMLIAVCTKNDIICSDVDEDFLANNCTKPERPTVEGDHGGMVSSELEGAAVVPGDRKLFRGGEGGGRPGIGGGSGGGRPCGAGRGPGKWGNLTDSEIEAMKLKRLTCMCCKDHEDDSD